MTAVRVATSEDAPAITAVRNASWQAAYPDHLPDSYWRDFDATAFAAHHAAMIERGTTRAFVAIDDGDVIGYSFYGAARDDDVEPGTREIFAIYVHPDAWSTGAGRVLMEATVAELGDVPIVLWVLVENARARRFYERAGFVADGAVKQADMPDGDVPEMRYRLQRSGG